MEELFEDPLKDAENVDMPDEKKSEPKVLQGYISHSGVRMLKHKRERKMAQKKVKMLQHLKNVKQLQNKCKLI